MRIDYQTKNYKPKDTLKDVIEKKVQKLDKYFDDDVTVKVAMRESNDREKMELTIFLGGTVLRSEVGDYVRSHRSRTSQTRTPDS